MYRYFIILAVFLGAFFLIYYLYQRDMKKQKKKAQETEYDPVRLEIIEAGLKFNSNEQFKEEDFEHYYRAMRMNLLNTIDDLRKLANEIT